MLRQVLHFLMVWQWGGGQRQMMSAIDACISSVEVYFPCTPTPENAEAQCLCEQYMWRATCFSNHGVESSPTFGYRNTTEIERDGYCKAAGSVSAEFIKRSYERDRRQVNSVLSSIASTVRLNGTTPTSTTPVGISSVVGGISSLASVPRVSSAVESFLMSAVVTSQAPAVVTSAAGLPATLNSVAVVPTTATPTSSSTSTTSDTSSSQTTSPPSPSGPSAGLIAGAVIGSVAVLVLAGILVMLILRHKKKNNNNPPDSNVEQGQAEKEVHHGEAPSGMHRGNEMSTTANAWELEGHVPPSAWELEAANTHHANDAKPAYLPKN